MHYIESIGLFKSACKSANVIHRMCDPCNPKNNTTYLWLRRNYYPKKVARSIIKKYRCNKKLQTLKSKLMFWRSVK